MFFIFGISNGEKQLDYNQTIVCPRCGHFGRLNVYMTYMYFSLFFIPIIIWNRKYYAKTTCCNTVYSINPETGKKIRKGEPVVLTEKDLKPAGGWGQTGGFGQYGGFGRDNGGFCPDCGYPVNPDFEYCPKCGRRLF